MNDKINKRYYGVADIAKELDISKSKVNFWREEFSKTIGKVRRDTKDNRRYNNKQRNIFHMIYILLVDIGMTIKGARIAIIEGWDVFLAINVEVWRKEYKDGKLIEKT